MTSSGSRGTRSHALSEAKEMLHVRMFEEVDYEGRLSAFLEQEVVNAKNVLFAVDGTRYCVSLWLLNFDEVLNQQ